MKTRKNTLILLCFCSKVQIKRVLKEKGFTYSTWMKEISTSYVRRINRYVVKDKGVSNRSSIMNLILNEFNSHPQFGKYTHSVNDPNKNSKNKYYILVCLINHIDMKLFSFLLLHSSCWSFANNLRPF